MATTSSRSPLRVIFFTVFLDLLGFGMVIPILPIYAEKMHASPRQIGGLLAIYSLMQLFFAPVWGRISDRVGRRPILLVSISGSMLSQLGYALSPSIAGLLIARAVAGVCGANISAAQAYVADTTDEKSRAGGMGMLGAAMGLGFVIGPAFGGFVSRYDPRLPFLCASALAALNLGLAFFVLREPRTRQDRSKARTLTWTALVRAVTTPRLMALIFLFFVITFGFANLEATFSLYLEKRFAYGLRETSYLFALVGVTMVVVQGALVRRLAQRLGERTLVIAGTALMALSLYLMSIATTVPLLLVAVLLVSAGNGINNPSLSSLISRAAGNDQQGGVMGVTQSFGASARIAGPLLGTWLLYSFGEGAPYLVAAIILGLASLSALLVVQQPANASATAPATTPATTIVAAASEDPVG